jgi:hypothetical protein
LSGEEYALEDACDENGFSGAQCIDCDFFAAVILPPVMGDR